MKEYTVFYKDGAEEKRFGWYDDFDFAKKVVDTFNKYHANVYLAERDVSEWRRVENGDHAENK